MKYNDHLIKKKDKSQEIFTTIDLKLKEGIKLYGCIRLADLSDQIEIIQ